MSVTINSFKRTSESALDKELDLNVIKQCELTLDQDGQNAKDRKCITDITGAEKIVLSDGYFTNLIKLFRYADSTDAWLMVFGSIAAGLNGLGLPFIAIIIGKITEIFTNITKQGFQLDDKSIYNTGGNTSVVTLQNDTIIGSDRDSFIVFMQEVSTSYFAVSGLTFSLVALQVFCWEMAAERQTHKLRKVFLSQILRQDRSWYDLNMDGDLSQKLSDDIERIREGIGCKLSFLVTYTSTFIFGIVVGIFANVNLTLVLLILAPVVIAAQAYIAKILKNSTEREQLRYGVAGGIASEVLNSVKLVASFSGEIRELKRYYKALEEGSKLCLNKYYKIAMIGFFLFFTSYGTLAVAFWYSSRQIRSNEATPGEIFTVFFSVMAGAFTVSNCLPYVNLVSTAVGSAYNIFSVIDRIPRIDPYSTTGRCIESLTGVIDFQSVCFSYPSRPQVQVLKDFSLKIESGKKVAIVGSSGSGKSTLVSLTLRFYDPTSGQVLLDGVNLIDLNLAWLRGRIGLVSQEPVLFGLSIAENIRYGRDHVTMEEITKAAQIANAHYFIKCLPKGYDTEVGNQGTMLSGGQKQRIAIARALVRDPKILLLDEATSALDSQSEYIVQEALENAMQGRTTVIVAHRLSTIKNSDLIITMKEGRVHETGTHEELMALRDLYYTLFTTQQKKLEMEEQEELLSDSERSEEVKIIDDPPVNKRLKSTGSMIRSFRSRKSSVYTIKTNLSEVDEKILQQELTDRVSFQKIFALMKGNLWLLAVALCACICLGITMPLIASFYADIFETFMLTGDDFDSAVAMWTVIFSLVAVVAGFANYTQSICFSILTERIIMSLRESAFRSLLSQQCSWFDLPDHAPGKLISSLSKDPPRIKTAAGFRAGQIVVALSVLSTSLIISYISSWKLAACLTGIIPLMIFANYKEIRLIKKHQERDSRLMDSAGQVSSEGIQSLKTVQALSKEKLFLDRYINHLELPYKEAKKQAIWFAIVFGINQGLLYVMYGVGFLSGAYILVQDLSVHPSQIYRTFFALSFCTTFVGHAASYVQEFYKAKTSIAFIYELIEQYSEDGPFSESGLKPDELNGDVHFVGVEFRYPTRKEVKVLRGINLKFPKGSTVALVGSSGCGKSTIMALLQRFYNPTKGKILLDGTDITQINVKWFRQQIGVVTQEPTLLATSIKENIAYGAINPDNVTLEEVIQAAKTANIHQFIASLPQGYDTEVGDMGAQLSGGQKQRIAIARAILRNPKILLLDEATSALDSESEKIVQEALDKARAGRTCIVIAHRLSTIRNADYIAVIQQGRVAEIGTHNQLLQSGGFYKQLVEQSLA